MEKMTILALLALTQLFGLVFGQIYVPPKCPYIELDRTIHRCFGKCSVFDCTSGYECCENACGGSQCMPDPKDCEFAQGLFLHAELTRIIHDPANNKCGDCFCNNGEEKCFMRDCKGPAP